MRHCVPILTVVVVTACETTEQKLPTTAHESHTVPIDWRNELAELARQPLPEPEIPTTLAGIRRDREVGRNSPTPHGRVVAIDGDLIAIQSLPNEPSVDDATRYRFVVKDGLDLVAEARVIRKRGDTYLCRITDRWAERNATPECLAQGQRTGLPYRAVLETLLRFADEGDSEARTEVTRMTRVAYGTPMVPDFVPPRLTARVTGVDARAVTLRLEDPATFLPHFVGMRFACVDPTEPIYKGEILITAGRGNTVEGHVTLSAGNGAPAIGDRAMTHTH